VLPLVAVLLSVAPAWSSLDDAGRAAAVQALKAEPMPGRLARAAEGFLGTPYVLSPLGEGAGRDPDPLLRLDAVDCVTLVEEALALSLAPDDGQVVGVLNTIRYAGAPAWSTRNHVMEAQWLPHNTASGRLRDVTRRWGGAATRRVSKRLSPATWREKSARALALEGAERPMGEFALDIVPAASVLAVLEHAPDGLVVVVVRADRPSLVTRVSHVGVLVHGAAGPALRHASRSFKRVVDEPLSRYLARNLDFARWTIEGVALFEPLGP
jgi:hypothetical protein